MENPYTSNEILERLCQDDQASTEHWETEKVVWLADKEYVHSVFCSSTGHIKVEKKKLGRVLAEKMVKNNDWYGFLKTVI